MTCCPLYSIRIDTSGFKLTRSQKKVLRKFWNYIINKRKPKNDCEVDCSNRNREVEPGADLNKPKAEKSKYVRQKRCKQMTSINSKEKSLEDLTNKSEPEGAKHTFEIRTIHAKMSNPSFAATFNETIEVFKKYQMEIHGEEEDMCTPASQFKRFLCEFSFKPGYGTYHQQYVIDGKIVAVGVLDILQDCISSVYFFYLPEYSFLSLGTVSSLFEIAYVRELEMKYYYLGFYIHSCPKMKYKAKYSGSYLLCPETFNWVPIEKCLPILEETKYAGLAGFDSDQTNLHTFHSAQGISD